VSGLASGHWLAPDAASTEGIAAAFSDSLPTIHEQALVVHLRGELGAGKTTWARGFLAARGVARVRSPTYSLLEIHELGELVVAHLDLYRLADPAEIDALGLADLDVPGTLWLVEWPERGGARLPDPDLVLHFADAGSGRALEAHARSGRALAWLRAATARWERVAPRGESR
jgi:tRNA threonylcarbamoyladenosine biosynthesis protein TsaE